VTTSGLRRGGLATSTCALAGAPAALAQGKHRTVVDRFSEAYAFAVDFDNLVTGRQRVQVTEVTAKDGMLLQTVFNIGLTETNANSETGEGIRVTASIHEVWDYASNTRTLSGKVWRGKPADGELFHDVGRITMDLDTREVAFLAGPHDVFFAGGIDPVVCAALAGT